MKPTLLRCLLLTLLSCTALAQDPSSPEVHIPLKTGWQLQSSAKIQASGEKISTPRFDPKGWYAVDVPTTVVAALVKHKVYSDPDFGMNLRSFPGMTYDIGKNFSEEPMAPDSPFNVAWWYRKEFAVPATLKGRSICSISMASITGRISGLTERSSRLPMRLPAPGELISSTSATQQ